MAPTSPPERPSAADGRQAPASSSSRPMFLADAAPPAKETASCSAVRPSLSSRLTSAPTSRAHVAIFHRPQPENSMRSVRPQRALRALMSPPAANQVEIAFGRRCGSTPAPPSTNG